MCFSAQASFIAAGFLSLIGLACLSKHQKKSDIPVALIPCMFAIQQVAEGCVWISLKHNYALSAHSAAYIFSWFAFFVWPAWIPYALYNLETDALRKQILAVLYYAGLILGTLLYGYGLGMGITPTAQESHIVYSIPLSDTYAWVATIAYLICTVGSALISSVPYVPIFGLLVAGAYGISYYAYYHYITSVWCFFAAVISGAIYIIMNRRNDQLHNVRNN